MLGVGMYLSVQRADHPSRGVLLNVVCPSVIVKPRQRGGPGPQGAVEPWKKNTGWAQESCLTTQKSFYVTLAPILYIIIQSELK